MLQLTPATVQNVQEKSLFLISCLNVSSYCLIGIRFLKIYPMQIAYYNRSQESGVQLSCCLGFNLDSVPH
ncbi:hypothetical protein Aazo_3918 ['Nostoc azollae' 0708]|jgi:hypothetical protein|uniref:Uncharacterized protein n=1 Tax=Nostoc azollae (strain 0708) TaxID=551115 RepID=D7E4V5_NOSA0|nr:hypothetical protein Aazo_3918 ['Nostoc azollae' 0708]